MEYTEEDPAAQERIQSHPKSASDPSSLFSASFSPSAVSPLTEFIHNT
ncbi:hypothetical protein [Planococcus glaciei]|nr:hypothetical protein [Planococcus glaciei]MBX0315449.1 hypothetical protein [Planococcus glaciei]